MYNFAILVKARVTHGYARCVVAKCFSPQYQRPKPFRLIPNMEYGTKTLEHCHQGPSRNCDHMRLLKKHEWRDRIYCKLSQLVSHQKQLSNALYMTTLCRSPIGGE